MKTQTTKPTKHKPPPGYMQAFGRLAARVKVGDKVLLEGGTEVFEVIDVSDPALVVLEAESGATFRAGRLAVMLAGDDG